MSIGPEDPIFNPAVSSDYCLVTIITIDKVKTFAVVLVKEGNPFPEKINDAKDIFLEVYNENDTKITVDDLFDAVSEVRTMADVYLPVRISASLYSESQEFFSQLFSKVVTKQFDDYPQSFCKH